MHHKNARARVNSVKLMLDGRVETKTGSSTSQGWPVKNMKTGMYIGTNRCQGRYGDITAQLKFLHHREQVSVRTHGGEGATEITTYQACPGERRRAKLGSKRRAADSDERVR